MQRRATLLLAQVETTWKVERIVDFDTLHVIEIELESFFMNLNATKR